MAQPLQYRGLGDMVVCAAKLLQKFQVGFWAGLINTFPSVPSVSQL